MAITNDDVVKALGNLSVLEMIALTKELEQKWGVKAEPPPAVYQPGPPGENQNTPEKSEYNVILASVPADKKMNVIKTVREVLTLGLKESKELVESAPKMVSEACSKDEADRIKAKLEEAGAVVEVK